MDALHALIDRYCQGWSDPDADTRARLLREVLTPDATYADPHTPAALPYYLCCAGGGHLYPRGHLELDFH